VNYLLDTDIFNHFQAGNRRVISRVDALPASSIAITVMTRIEVLQGRFEFMRKAATTEEFLRAQRRLNETDTALATWRIVPIDSGACQEFIRLRAVRGLRKIGRADLLIASIALANQATRNVKDFALVPGLAVENWVD
jgi:tRNA(fMet)-specific endonuclease VapC